MSKAIQLFGKMLTFSRIKITTDNLGDIQAELTDALSGNSATANIPVVIDSDVNLDLEALVDTLWQLGVQPIGVVDGVLNTQAKQLRLAILPPDGKRLERIQPKEDRPVKPAVINKPDNSTNNNANTAVSTPVQASTYQPQPSSTYAQMVRSGQSIHHFGGDLTIIGGVNQGAEAITDSNLHIYGRGLGRLVAGATGDKDARIFCQKFNPTLVSVAGTYCLSEDIPSEMIDEAVQVSYDEKEGLVFTKIDT